MKVTSFVISVALSISGGIVGAQNTPTPAASANEIHVSSDCGIFSGSKPGTRGSKPKYRNDAAICTREGAQASEHWEQRVVNGKPKDVLVRVREVTYLLGNWTQAPAIFVVDHELPKGWTIDSDPAPSDISSGTATFRVNAEPGQIVRLHVGERN